MSDTSARASRRAFWFGSFARKGLIGFRCTTAGGGAGVDGVEKAAETLPVGVNAGGAACGFGVGGAAGSGIVGRDGGVSGAPKAAPKDVAARSSRVGPATVGGGALFWLDGVGAGAESLPTAGVNFGENGGVRWRTGVDDWLGGGAGAGRDGAAGVAGVGGRGAGAVRGTGGGQAFAGTDAAGVRPRGITGFAPEDVAPTVAVAVAGAGT